MTFKDFKNHIDKLEDRIFMAAHFIKMHIEKLAKILSQKQQK